tara:strand:+ start:41 stop:223 length:183 start_codon:yes stop_codon:yes gene_type:complete
MPVNTRQSTTKFNEKITVSKKEYEELKKATEEYEELKKEFEDFIIKNTFVIEWDELLKGS